MNLQRCEPRPSYSLLTPDPQFFKLASNVVSATFDGEGEAVTHGISFDDYSRMQTVRKAFVSRRRGGPTWPFETAMLRRVIVRYFCNRAFGSKQMLMNAGLTEAELLKKAMAVLESRIPHKTATLSGLCHEYVLLKHAGNDPARLKRLTSIIAGVDGDLRMCVGNAPATITAVIYHSYNLGENSVEVGAALGIKPPAIRQLLRRLNITHRHLVDPSTPPQTSEQKQIRREAAARRRREQQQC